MSSLQRVALLSIVLLVAVPSLAGAESRRAEKPAEGLVEVVVTLDEPPLGRTVGADGLRTLAGVSGARHLASVQRTLAARMLERVPGLEIQHRYSVVVDGFAATLPASELETLEDTHGVAKVYPSVAYHALRSSSPGFIRAPALWGPTLATAGNGIRIGILDDGLDASHRYFSGRGFRTPRGFPKGQKRFTTAKVIVARAFAPRSTRWKFARRPFDPTKSDHATHVAGIAAGNYRTRALGARISGVAPKAYLGNYKVLTVPDGPFGLNGNSPEIVAGVEAAVRDGMDVINLSLGEAEIEPGRDIVAKALDGAAAAGVIPVVAAGNDYEELGAGSVTSPGSSERAITAAAESESGPYVASFSSGGPTPLSLRMKPDVTAPGVDVLSSVPRREGSWADFSGTSMAAPHVAGAAALLRQRHRGWTVEQIKSALVQTGRPVLGPVGGEAETTREGGGTIDVLRANNPLLFASPTGLSFGYVQPGGSALRQVSLTDAGGGSGAWTVTVTPQQAAAGTSVSALSSVTVPGPLAITASAGPAATQATHTGFVVLSRGSEQRRIPYWFRVTAPTLGAAQTTPLTGTGTYRGDTSGRPSLVDSYRYPEDPRGFGVNRVMSGPEQVFRVTLSRRVGNFGVAVTRGPGDVEPRVVRAGDENQLVGETGLPYSANPYLSGFGRPVPVAGAVLPAPGQYDVVFDSPSARGAGAFTFRFWVADMTPPRLRLVSARNGVLRLRATDAGAGVDPAHIRLSIDGRRRAARYQVSSGLVVASTRGLRRGRHSFRLQVSDYQESKNMENVRRILPNTARLRGVFTIR
jgi:subtilisin family serine protease